jgi:hypothetical protein
MNMTATTLRFFAPDHLQYEGVRPIQVWGVRAFYLMMLTMVAPEAWGVLLRHEGPWQPVHAAAWCIWATYPTLAMFGLLRPLQWLPLMIFTVGYKALWWLFVALPLVQTGTLSGSTAEEMAYAFGFASILCLVVPWTYVWRHYVVGVRG